MQFFKRNDFKVKVLRESAGVCPVKDKHSPLFNLWTACDSIKSLVGVYDIAQVESTPADTVLRKSGKVETITLFVTLGRILGGRYTAGRKTIGTPFHLRMSIDLKRLVRASP